MTDEQVAAGLRALREEAPSDETRRAALARLGLTEAPAALALARPTAGSARARSSHTLLWLLLGVLLGVLALALQRWSSAGG
jgi:hypothetical protein